MKTQLYYCWLLIVGISLSACQKEQVLYAEKGEEYAGGATTFFNTSRNAFSFAAPNLKGLEALQFTTGNSFFNQSWVSAVASTTGRDGLGPLFNETACSGCHFKDGRGRTPMFNEKFGHGMLIRLSVPGVNAHGGPLAAPMYGGQLSPGGINGIQGEGTFEIHYTEIAGTYGDGTSYSLRKPTYVFQNLAYGNMDNSILFSPRVANQMVGMGLLDAIEISAIKAYVDESDADGDGISGKANLVYNRATNTMDLGRFGWKAGEPTVRQQVAGAFVGDIGITSSLFLDENHTNLQTDCQTVPNGNNNNGYELDDQVLDRVELYSSTLAVPGRRDWNDQAVLKGKELFLKANCQKCHVQKYKTGTHPKFDALSNQTIYPYTDLLLHDMGEGLADNRPEYLADGQEWRTAPLWGIGLIENVNGHTEFLHDGRARNLAEAILWHGGEGEASKEAFRTMSAEEREQLILFVKSL
ncbi:MULTISPECIES: di-heme oxidoredictase family protein [unclassified Aureispira]|uniref:di-heme oxidoreductase family protein n=1 Tax=unclassified Aureispira TaxID=2649989 RepID=UPI000698B285|nr:MULTISPECIES: di-heme oxidoredictase family protein [unclassified Aureispira]WMX13983.1 di-heme oxidoredictase family protein [Aureispira sp. CCB-E]